MAETKVHLVMKSRGMSAEGALAYVKYSEYLYFLRPRKNVPLIACNVEDTLWLDLMPGFESNLTFGLPVAMVLLSHTLHSEFLLGFSSFRLC